MNRTAQRNRIFVAILGVIAFLIGTLCLVKGATDSAFYWLISGIAYSTGLILLVGLLSSFYQPPGE